MWGGGGGTVTHTYWSCEFNCRVVGLGHGRMKATWGWTGPVVSALDLGLRGPWFEPQPGRNSQN